MNKDVDAEEIADEIYSMVEKFPDSDDSTINF